MENMEGSILLPGIQMKEKLNNIILALEEKLEYLVSIYLTTKYLSRRIFQKIKMEFKK